MWGPPIPMPVQCVTPTTHYVWTENYNVSNLYPIVNNNKSK